MYNQDCKIYMEDLEGLVEAEVVEVVEVEVEVVEVE
jgi:hypothetical protein